jgi:hypothetical protein
MAGSKVIQFNQVRKEKQETLKRDYERVLFNRILGCYTVIEKLGLKSVEVLDISKSGVSFRLESAMGAFDVGEAMDFRFYFSNNTFIPARIIVKRKTKVEENGRSYFDYGASLDREHSAYPAIDKFVDFINAYAAAAKEDKGDKQVFFL